VVGESDIIRCIDIALNRLGPNVRRLFIYHMRREFGVKRYEIPQKPTQFIKALRHIFGESAENIETEILKTIELELNLRPKGGEDLLTLFNELKARAEEEKAVIHPAGPAEDEVRETVRR